MTCCLALAVTWVQAQNIAQVLTPSPLGVAITVGQWLVKDRKRVFEVEVEARAPTLQQARDQAFRLAIERAVGTMVLSETEVRSSRINRDDIITYSSGYVDRFEVLGQDSVGGEVRVRMRIWVSHSAISTRLLARSQADTVIDGERFAEQAKSVQQERLSGDRLLAAVLRDYPHRAFSADIGRIELWEDNRLIKLLVPFTLRMDYNYLTSLSEGLEQTSQRPAAGHCTTSLHSNPCGNQTLIRVVSGRPPAGSGRFFGWNTTSGFNDAAKMNMIYNTMIASKPAILLTVTDQQGRRAFRSCYFRPELDQDIQYVMPERSFLTMSPMGMSVNGDVTIRDKLEVNLGSYAERVRDFYRAEIRVVNCSEC
jgi:hypothetical protein